MLVWLGENIYTILICALLLLVVGAIIVNMVRNKKKGKSSCGCGCADCPMNNACHGKK